MKHTASSLKTLKVSELKDLCTKNNISSNGKKEELIARLIDIDSQESNQTVKALKNDAVADTNLSDISGLESIPGSDSTQALDGGAESKTGNGLNASGIVSSPTSVNENGLNKDVDLKAGSEKNPKRSETLNSLPDSERARLRAEKFGTSSSSSSHPQPSLKDEEEERRRKRAERFGSSLDSSAKKTAPQPKTEIGSQLASSLTAIASISPEEKLRLRAERFGVDCSSIVKTKGTTPVIKAVENKGAPKTTITAEDKEKLEARQKRFKLASTTSLKDTLSPSELEKLAKRAERFGLNKS